MPIKNSISIRSYSLQKRGHSHDFHQLVLPLKGGISIEVGGFEGKVKPGECVVVKQAEPHYFAAEPNAKFVVADLDTLPDNLMMASSVVFSVTPPLRHYLSFIEEQLKYQVRENIETLMLEMFYQLLSEQQVLSQFDHRIQKAVDYIEQHLSSSFTNSQLANIACLSPTQFKKLFKQQTGVTVTQYVTQLRMEKAQALLLHTDYPIQLVADVVGYSDHAAFSRRFLKYFGLSPSKFAR